MKNITLKTITKIFVFVFVALGFFAISKVQANAGELSLHVINIGHGDALLLESDGHYMLVDSGEKENKDILLSYLEKHIEGNVIDHVVATHADQDHVGGFPSVLEKYEIKHMVYSEPTKSSKAFKNFEKAIYNEEGLIHGNAYEGQIWNFGDASVKVIYDGRQGTTYNESSIVMKVTCDKKTILLTGDLPTTMEEKLMSKGYNFKADILKVAHHGAAASTSGTFLDKVKPEYAVIPNGMAEKTFFPKDSVLQRLALRFIKTHLATDGDIVMNIKNGVISTTHKENTKFQCISKGQIVVIGKKFVLPDKVGKKVTPEIHVYANGELISSSHYDVTMKGNSHTGYATVKVTGNKKKYVGTLETFFPILPRKTKIYKASRSENKKKIHLQWSKQSYATGYIVSYSSDRAMKKDAKTIIIKGGKHNTKTFKVSKKKKKYYFKIRAFTDGIGKGKWCPKKCVK